jgi:hypothetical protein
MQMTKSTGQRLQKCTDNKIKRTDSSIDEAKKEFQNQETLL